MPDPVSIRTPERSPCPVVFDSPHSGTNYPDDFHYLPPFARMREVEDTFVHELFAAAPRYGATLIDATFPRSYIDPNRARTDIDETMLDAPWPGNRDASAKSARGVGLIRRHVGQERLPVYNGLLSVGDVQHRIDRYWAPYHAAVRGALDAAHSQFGAVWHINCHSTPSVWPPVYEKAGQLYENDFGLGDRDGTTCEREFTEFVASVLRSLGHSVAINDGQKGVELVRAYSDPARRRHSLQIEVNRALYLNEADRTRSPGFAACRDSLETLAERICAYARERTER